MNPLLTQTSVLLFGGFHVRWLLEGGYCNRKHDLKGADRGSRKMWFVELLFTEQALQSGNCDKFMECEAYNNDSQPKPEVRLKKYY